MSKRSQLLMAAMLACCAMGAFAQPPMPGGPRGGPPGGPPGGQMNGPMNGPGRGPGGRGPGDMPSSKWWFDPILARRIGLSPDQQTRIDRVFQQNRIRLIELSASLEKEEAVLEGMLDSEHPEEAKMLAQVDQVANARAELEKANGRMLMGMRTVLTTAQWRRLQAEDPSEPPGGRRGGPPQ